MSNKMIGIGAVVSTSALIIFSILIYAKGEFLSALHLKLGMLFFVMSFVFSFLFLVKNYTIIPRKTDLLIGGILGSILIIYTALVSFHVLNITTHFNWIIVLGIVFTALMQTALLRQRRPNFSLIRAICAQLVLVADLFLIIFFIVNWSSHEFSIWLNIALLISLLAFVIGFLIPISTPDKDK